MKYRKNCFYSLKFVICRRHRMQKRPRDIVLTHSCANIMGGGLLLKCFTVALVILSCLGLVMEVKPMDCTHLRYPTVEQLPLIDISSNKNLPFVLYLRYTSLVFALRRLVSTTVQSNCYFRAEK